MVWAHVTLHSEGPQQWKVLGMECVETEVDGGSVLFARGKRRCVVLEYAAETKLTLRLLVSGMTSVVLPQQPALLLYTGRTGELHSESLTPTAGMPSTVQDQCSCLLVGEVTHAQEARPFRLLLSFSL